MPHPDNVCQREGCGQWKRPGYSNCSPLCAAIEQELHYIERLVRRAGPGQMSAQCWAAAVSMGDNHAQMQKLRRRLGRIAKRQEDQAQSAESSTSKKWLKHLKNESSISENAPGIPSVSWENPREGSQWRPLAR